MCLRKHTNETRQFLFSNKGHVSIHLVPVYSVSKETSSHYHKTGLFRVYLDAFRNMLIKINNPYLKKIFSVHFGKN